MLCHYYADGLKTVEGRCAVGDYKRCLLKLKQRLSQIESYQNLTWLVNCKYQIKNCWLAVWQKFIMFASVMEFLVVVDHYNSDLIAIFHSEGQ